MSASGPPLQVRTMSRPGCRLSYRYRPSTSGEWVVFLHGAGMDGRMFDAQMPAVPTGVGVICWDARGHGRSALRGPFRYGDMLADLGALVAGVNAERLHLVGQSMGGSLAQTFVDDNPGAVDTLVLVDCTTNHGPLSRVDRLALHSTTTILRLYPWGLLVRRSARACGTAPATVEYAEQCLRRIGRRRFVEVMGFWSEALRPDPSYRLPVPTLAMLGDQDRSGDIRAASTRLDRLDPRVRLVMIPDAAHCSAMDQPALANRAIGAFLGW